MTRNWKAIKKRKAPDLSSHPSPGDVSKMAV
jgi:hypothetical protein